MTQRILRLCYRAQARLELVINALEADKAIARRGRFIFRSANGGATYESLPRFWEAVVKGILKARRVQIL